MKLGITENQREKGRITKVLRENVKKERGENEMTRLLYIGNRMQRPSGLGATGVA